MLRCYNHSRVIYGLCRLLSNQVSKRFQSSLTGSNIGSQLNLSNVPFSSGHVKALVTHNLEVLRPENVAPIAIYQILDSDGNIKDESQTPAVSN